MNPSENHSFNYFSIWERAGVYTIEKESSKPKWYQIFAYPGPSGFLHVGTLRSYTYPDVIAKFKRFTGFNVYFPAGIHASGLPAVSFSEKVNSGKYDEYLKVNNCSSDIIKQFSTPVGVVEFFKNNYFEIWKQMGFFINEETGIPTTIDPGYQKFIQWQFRTLFKKGYLVQKEYITSFCSNDGPIAIDSAETDLSSGGKAQIFEYTVIKFLLVDKLDDFYSIKGKMNIITATLRPETVFGVTNIWISPKTKYTIIENSDEYYIIAENSISNITTIFSSFKIIATISSEELTNKQVKNPITQDIVPIIPSIIVKDDLGTGIVMSVPAHSPVDYLAYKESIKNKFNIKPPMIVVSSIFQGIPAEETVNKYSIKRISEIDKVESAISYIHMQEIEHGIIQYNYKDYQGTNAKNARNKIIKELKISNKGFTGYFFTEPVICRCGNRVQIRSVPDQWFIKYSDPVISEMTKFHVRNNMKIFPSALHDQMADIIDWFIDRPCVRTGKWLGTEFPISKNEKGKLIIEPIADSTIYPIYYIISKYLHSNSISNDSLTDDFFNFVFLNEGNSKDTSMSTGIEPVLLHKIQQDFENWYPIDCNFGGKEHNTVHFPVFLKMHAMMFPQKFWPKNIFVNWWVMQNINQNTKIGKSKGGAGSVSKIINDYSADAIRLYYCHAASPHVDLEWSEKKIEKYQNDIEKIKSLIYSIESGLSITDNLINSEELENWLHYKLQEKFTKMYDYLEQFEIRKMSQECFYTIPKIIWRFIHREGNFSNYITEEIKIWLMFISMVTPFTAEEINHKFKFYESIFCNSNRIVKPVITAKPAIIEEEDFIDKIVDDIIKIKKIVKNVNKTEIYIYALNSKNDSSKTEVSILSSAIPYIFKKTGCRPIILSIPDSEESDSRLYLNRPKLVFK